MGLLPPQDRWRRRLRLAPRQRAEWRHHAWVHETTGQLALSVLDCEAQSGGHWLRVEVRITVERMLDGLGD